MKEINYKKVYEQFHTQRVIIAGPCAVESNEQINRLARKLKDLGIKSKLENKNDIMTGGRKISGNAAKLMEKGIKLVTDGTDNHMMVANTMESIGMDGSVATKTLEKAGITINKQVIPDDPNPPYKPSGFRIGTPALTTRGMKEAEMELIAGWIHEALTDWQDETKLGEIRGKVVELTKKFPLYPELV